MARIELAPGVGDDLERVLEHLLSYAAKDVQARVQEIVAAIDVLETNPLIGRPASGGKRELVIGGRSGGCVALYRYVRVVDTAFVFAIRNRREAGNKHD
jgi:plasmid stabilization system protein ParE